MLPEYNLNRFKPHSSDTANLALALGSSGAWDDTQQLHPCAVSVAEVVYLFYTGYHGGVGQIGVASANVAGFTGVNLTKYGSNPILAPGSSGAWDAAGVSDPWVIYDGAWKMWYRGLDVGGTMRLGYATSSDGMAWTKYASNPVLSPAVTWEGTQVILPAVYRVSSSDYRMLYAGNEPASTNGRIGLATSSDGMAWTKYASNPVLSPAGSGWMAASVFSPRTLVYSGKWQIYFSAKHAVDSLSKCGYAESPDLLAWTVGINSPLLFPTHTWEGSESENPNWLEVAGRQYVFYDNYYGSPATLGVAVVPRQAFKGAVLLGGNTVL